MTEKNHSRVNKYERRRKNTKFMTYSIIAAGILAIVLLIVIVNGGKSDKTAKELPNTVSTPHESKNKKDEDNDNHRDTFEKGNKEPKKDKDEETDQSDSVKKDKKDKKDSDGVVTERVESSDDNVANAFTGNWEPVGTEQTGSHTISYSDGTQDRIEMEKAITVATGLEAMTVWWLERGGDQAVVATVSNKNDQSEIYRVHLEWVDDAGWKPTKVELLKENDQKWRFQ